MRVRYCFFYFRVFKNDVKTSFFFEETMSLVLADCGSEFDWVVDSPD